MIAKPNTSPVEERARNINRLQKFLEGANVKPGSWLSDVEGKSATELLELVIGKPDFTVDEVAKRMHGNMKSTAEEMLLSLNGSITPTLREFFTHVMAVIREQTAQIEKTDAMIGRSLSDNYNAEVKALDAIPGISRVSAEQIIAETSPDMSHFRNQHSLSKWAGVCPGNNESAGKRKSGKTPHGNKTLKSTLTQCAKSAKNNKKSFFSAQYSRLVGHRGKNRATMAVAHSIFIVIFLCAEVDREAREMMETVQNQLRAKKPRPRGDFMATVQYETAIRDQAEEVVLNEIVYKRR